MSAAWGIRRPPPDLRAALIADAASRGWEDCSRFEGDVYLAMGDYRLVVNCYGAMAVRFPRGEGSQLVSSVEEATAVVVRRRGEGLLDRIWREHIEREGA